MINNINDKYKIIRELGSGSMGVVYLVESNENKQWYALKKMKPVHFLDDAKAKRFENEYSLIAQIEHKNIVKLVEHNKESGIPYLVMEYMDGGSLSDLLSFGVLSISHAIFLITEVMNGLKYAHSVGIRHADLKTSNILLSRDGHIKITDFGLATIMVDSERMGTPAYMAPEVITEDKVDQRADIYALGVILYEITTGKLPFTGRTSYEVLQKHLKEKPVLPSSIIPEYPQELERIIIKALSKNPEERFLTVKEMLNAIEQIPLANKSDYSSFGIELNIKTLPDKAQVYLNEVFRGDTPLKLTNLLPGSVNILIKKKGYQDIHQKITFKSSTVLSLNYQLKSFSLPVYEVELGNTPACNFSIIGNSLIIGAKHGELLEVDMDTGHIISSMFIGGEFTESLIGINTNIILSLKDNRVVFIKTAFNPPLLKGCNIYKIINLQETIVGDIATSLLRTCVGTENGNLYCFKLLSGELVYKKNYDLILKGIYQHPENETVFLSFQNGIFKAVDAVLGKDIWTFETSSSYYLTPIFFEGKIILISAEGTIYCLTAKDGNILFRQFLNRPIKSVFYFDRNCIYLHTQNNSLIAVNINNQQIIWETKLNNKTLLHLQCYPAYIFDQLLNIVLSNGYWIKVDKRTGNIVFEHNFESSIDYLPKYKDGLLYFIDSKGKLYAIPLT